MAVSTLSYWLLQQDQRQSIFCGNLENYLVYFQSFLIALRIKERTIC
jgi:hypothetical protein